MALEKDPEVVAKASIELSMDADRPEFKEYLRWLEEEHSVDVQTEKGRYEATRASAVQAVLNSVFFKDFLRRRRDIDDRYEATSGGYRLFANDSDEALQAKSWESFIEKTWRKNVVHNSNWPDPPDRGWLLPSNWYSNVNDIVRGTLVVKYLDGVEILVKELQATAERLSLPFEYSLEARDEGYYAAHTYTRHVVQIPSATWDMHATDLAFELQVTTQLQEVIRKLTHREYESRRVKMSPDVKKWQWDFESDSFKPNYLGHILHYMEGMIMEVRQRGNP